MGRKAMATQEEVFLAADKLLSEGKEVTANNLLGALGGGSLTTIYRHLNDWRETRPSAALAGPIEIPEPVQTAFESAWRVAATESAKEIAAAREKATEEVKEAQGQFKEALAAIERLEAELEAETNENDALKEKVTTLESALQTAAGEKSALSATGEQQKQRIAQLESELAKKDQTLKESFELKGQLDAMRTQNRELLAQFTPPPQAPKGKK